MHVDLYSVLKSGSKKPLSIVEGFQELWWCCTNFPAIFCITLHAYVGQESIHDILISIKRVKVNLSMRHVLLRWNRIPSFRNGHFVSWTSFIYNGRIMSPLNKQSKPCGRATILLRFKAIFGNPPNVWSHISSQDRHNMHLQFVEDAILPVFVTIHVQILEVEALRNAPSLWMSIVTPCYFKWMINFSVALYIIMFFFQISRSR